MVIMLSKCGISIIVIIRLDNSVQNYYYYWSRYRFQATRAFASDALKHKEAPIVDNEVILSEKEVKEREKLR